MAEEKHTENDFKNENPQTTESVSGTVPTEKSNEKIAFLRSKTNEVKQEIAKVLIGQEKTVDLLLTALLTNGHVLLEGVPGIAKTLTARLISRTLSCDFSRIQFTPDMMPSDVIGTNVYNQKKSEFEFNKGPVFSNIVLIDEINRSPAKTQSALFEVMEERQITVDGTTRKLPFPFFVIATQNPIEQEGTYQLPEAQLDRFTFKIRLTYPTYEEEVSVLTRFKDSGTTLEHDVKPVLTPEDLMKLQEAVNEVHIDKSLIEYIAAVTGKTRESGDLFLGASPRASLAALHTSKAVAALQGRDYVTPDDIKFVFSPVLNHRLILSTDKEVAGAEVDEVLSELINQVEVPR